MMFKMEEVMETFSKLSVPDRELVCSSLFYCLNWYREVGDDDGLELLELACLRGRRLYGYTSYLLSNKFLVRTVCMVKKL